VIPSVCIWIALVSWILGLVGMTRHLTSCHRRHDRELITIDLTSGQCTSSIAASLLRRSLLLPFIVVTLMRSGYRVDVLLQLIAADCLCIRYRVGMLIGASRTHTMRERLRSDAWAMSAALARRSAALPMNSPARSPTTRRPSSNAVLFAVAIRLVALDVTGSAALSLANVVASAIQWDSETANPRAGNDTSLRPSTGVPPM
jgi:hypothetical protein